MTHTTLKPISLAIAITLSLLSSSPNAQSRQPLPSSTNTPNIAISGFIIQYKTPLAASHALSSQSQQTSSPKLITPASLQPLSLSKHPSNPSRLIAAIPHASPSNPTTISPQTLQQSIQSLQTDSNILSVSPNYILKPYELPSHASDSNLQWHLNSSSQGSLDISNTRAHAPATTTTPYAPIVAVLDTGYTNHPDIANKTIAEWDFVNNSPRALDTGDSSNGSESTWHGTRVSGTITTNNINTLGINYHSRLIHARVLGPGGGTSDNIANAIRWAAGISVPNVPKHAYGRADFINLSLGTESSSVVECTDDFKAAIADANAAGSVVVVATGNGGYSHIGMPANCPGVIAVGASTSNGDAAFYSNLGTGTTLIAPGGDYANPFYTTGISSSPSSQFTPVFSSSSPTMGTSFATPATTGALSLLLSLFPSQSPSSIAAATISSTKKFPSSTFCTLLNNQASCGSGLLSIDSAFSSLLKSAGASLSYTTPQATLYPSESTLSAPTFTVTPNLTLNNQPLSTSTIDTLYLTPNNSDSPPATFSNGSFSIPFPSNTTPNSTTNLSYTLHAIAPSQASSSPAFDLSIPVNLTAINAHPPVLSEPTNPITLSTTKNTPSSVDISNLIFDQEHDFDHLTAETSDSTPLFSHGISINGSTLSWSNPTDTPITLTIHAVDSKNLSSSDFITIQLTPTKSIPTETPTPTPSPSSPGGSGGSLPLYLLLLTAPLRKLLRPKTSK